jgi:hypothetical protein
MVIPHYAYLVLKMLGLRGFISIRGDVKRSFDYERESCETTDRLIASTVLLELKAGLGQAPPPRPGHARGQDLQGVHPVGGHTQQDDSVIRGGAFQGCSRRQQAGS